MPGRLRQRAVLPPAGHPPEDQPGIACKTGVGPKAELFHHAGAKPFDQGVGGVDQAFGRFKIVGVLEVQRD